MIPFYRDDRRIYSMSLEHGEVHVYESYADDIEDVETEVSVDENALGNLVTALGTLQNAKHLGVDLTGKQLMKYQPDDSGRYYIGLIMPPANGGEWTEKDHTLLFRILYMPYTLLAPDGGIFVCKYSTWIGNTVMAHREYLEEFPAPATE